MKKPKPKFKVGQVVAVRKDGRYFPALVTISAIRPCEDKRKRFIYENTWRESELRPLTARERGPR